MGDDAIVENSPIKASVVFKIVQIVLLAGIRAGDSKERGEKHVMDRK